MKEVYQKTQQISKKKQLGKKKVAISAAIKDPLRPFRAASVLQKLERALERAQAGEGIAFPLLTIPQVQLNRAINDLARDGKVTITAIDGDVVIKLVDTQAPETPKVAKTKQNSTNNGGIK